MVGAVQEAYFNILVPTVDTTRYAYMMSTIIASGRNVLFAGDTGVGKSVIINDALLRMTTGPEPKFVNATVNFSAQTQSYNLQEVLETKLDTKRKNRWGVGAGLCSVFAISSRCIDLSNGELMGGEGQRRRLVLAHLSHRLGCQGQRLCSRVGAVPTYSSNPYNSMHSC